MHVALIHVRSDRSGRALGYQELLNQLNTAAIEAIRSIDGWTVSLLAADEGSESSLFDAARRADLVVIMGGEDIDPRLYGAVDARAHRTPYEPRADRRQIAILLEAARTNRPVLGLCRGHQLINVAFGGTLHQEIRAHRIPGSNPFVTTPVALGNELEGLVPEEVLCTHHQAIDALGAGLRAVARAQDGTIEAVQHESYPVFGVQWHPEHPDVALEQLLGLLQEWVLTTRKEPVHAPELA